MSWVAVAIAGSAVLGAAMSNKAAKDQAGAAGNAAQAERAQFEQNRADMAPWRETGGRALSTLEARRDELTRPFSLKDFLADPGYNFRLSEGEKAINRAAAARGSWDSGATGRALTRYGQDYASGEYANAYNRFGQDQANEFNRLSGIAGTGQTTAQQVGAMGAASTARANDYQLSGAAARGAGSIGAANAVSGGVGQAFNQYNSYRLIDALGSRNTAQTPYYAANDPYSEANIGGTYGYN
mgnify:CR=1 FL=1